jgi:transcriptional regulator with XRE-family HTH domain
MDQQYSKEELIGYLRQEANRLGKIPTTREVGKVKTIKERFGSWNNAIQIAFDKKEISREDVLDYLNNYFENSRLIPDKEYLRKNNKRMYNAIVRFWRSYSNVLDDSGLKSKNGYYLKLLGEAIKKERKRKHITQQEMSHLLNVSSFTIRSIENGMRDIRRGNIQDNINKLIEILEISNDRVNAIFLEACNSKIDEIPEYKTKNNNHAKNAFTKIKNKYDVITFELSNQQFTISIRVDEDNLISNSFCEAFKSYIQSKQEEIKEIAIKNITDNLIKGFQIK